jgi:hypothetical protein
MRPAPYPASEDSLLAEMFGKDVVAGLTVLCAGGGQTGENHWTVVVTQNMAGDIHALECVRRPDRRPTTSSTTLTSQADWTDLFARVTDPSLDADIFFSVTDWMNAQIAMSKRDPHWDEEAALDVWDEVADRTEAAVSALDAECRKLENLTEDERIERVLRDLAPPIDARTREIERALEEFSQPTFGLRPN